MKERTITQGEFIKLIDEMNSGPDFSEFEDPDKAREIWVEKHQELIKYLKTPEGSEKIREALKKLAEFARSPEGQSIILDLANITSMIDEETDERQREFLLSLSFSQTREYFKALRKRQDAMRDLRVNNGEEPTGRGKPKELRGNVKKVAENRASEFIGFYYKNSMRKTAAHFKISRDGVLNLAEYLGLKKCGR